MKDEFGALRRAKTMLLTTYKRDGTGVGTPVSIAFGGDHAYFRSYDKAWKSRRLRRNPQVDVAPSDFRGNITGQHLHGTARLLEGEEAGAASRALARRHPLLHGMVVPLMHRVRGYQTLHYELSAGPRPS